MTVFFGIYSRIMCRIAGICCASYIGPRESVMLNMPMCNGFWDACGVVKH